MPPHIDFVRVQTYVAPAKGDELKQLAVENGQSVAAYVRMVLYRHLRDQNSNHPPIQTAANS